MRRYIKALLALAVILPACDQFVCSQSRIRAIEIANKGVEQFTNRAYEAAERELRLAIQTDPTYEKAYYNLGKVYQAQRKWDKAAEAFESAVQRSPDNANFHYDLGEAYLESKQLDKAESALKKATELAPDNARMMVVPEGCAHGFQVLEPESELLYLHTALYVPEAEGGVSCNDPRLGISWPLPVAGLSRRDCSFPPIAVNFSGIAA